MALGVGGGVVGGAPTHVYMHAHAHTCTHAHTRVVNMIISYKWPSLLGESLGIPMMSYACTHACMHVHVHGGHPLTTPHPQGRDQGISQNSIALELIEIFQFHLKI